MAASLVKGTVFGGLVLFVWGAISWMALPWHDASLSTFRDEDAVLETILANAPRSGVYLLPQGPAGTEGMTPEQARAAEQALMQGPAVFASVRREGMGSMALLLMRQLLIQMAGALLITALLLHARPLPYAGRVAFVAAVAAAAGILGHLPAWNWFGFGTAYTLVEIADLLIGWTLAGLVIAKLVGQAPAVGAAAVV